MCSTNVLFISSVAKDWNKNGSCVWELSQLIVIIVYLIFIATHANSVQEVELLLISSYESLI
jgi:hypothetical protein